MKKPQRRWVLLGREHPMHSFVPPRSGAAGRKPAARLRRPVAAPRPVPALLLFSGGNGARREAQAAPHLPGTSRTAHRLPEGLQTVMEAMSGFSLADVVVHRNSAEPARFGAVAFAKGDQIHMAPGQERHLPHEAWHVVQQKQGRVRPTLQMKSGVVVNDNPGLEREADAMGMRALQAGASRTEAVPARPTSAPAVQRVPIVQRREIVISEGKTITTEDMRLNELRALRTSHPEVADEIDEAIANGEYLPTRTRKAHNDSDAESEEETPIYSPEQRSYYRSLREEEAPELEGLKPPEGFDPNLTARQHVTSGSKAQTKSAYVSATHSRSVSSAWASQSSGRFAKFTLPPSTMLHDLTSKKGQKDTGLKGTGLNAAKSSQEIIALSDPPEMGIPPEYVESIYSAKKIKKKEFNKKKRRHDASGTALLRTRRKASEKPERLEITRIYNREEASARRVKRACAEWEHELNDIVEQTNSQYKNVIGFEPIDRYDVEEFMEEQGVESPYTLDYISNREELEKYLGQLLQAGGAFIDKQIQKWARQ